MKTVILAGGLGTRLAEETDVKPKPMVEIGGQPILSHILRIYDHYGFREFLIALGYKGEYIKRYVMDFCSLGSDLTVNTRTGDAMRSAGCDQPDWTVHLIDTGKETNTGGRVRRLAPRIGNETFMMTYGDGVGNVDIPALIKLHKAGRRLATITAVRPPARWGTLEFDGNRVARFLEKPQTGTGWINGGFMVLEPGVIDYIASDSTSFETEVLERLAADGQLQAYKHEGFWQPMDTLREKRLLESLWESGKAPWKVW
jgi:glucose-1-phosphate cytidylyltransferase